MQAVGILCLILGGGVFVSAGLSAGITRFGDWWVKNNIEKLNKS